MSANEDTESGRDTGADGDVDADTDSDTDSDSDSDSDADTDTDSDTDTDADCDGCLIDSICYPPGETNSLNICQICDPAEKASAWSSNDGVSCEDDGSYCTGQEICVGETCQSDGDPCSADEVCFEDEDRCCAPEHHRGCGADGNIYYFDSCDRQGEQAEQCIGAQFCRQGACGCADGWTGLNCDRCVIYVSGASGDDSLSGASWDTAKQTLQAGIEAADDTQNISDCEVWVERGVYHPTPDDDREATFTIRERVAVYGGFAGSETARRLRDWDANPTILSGDIGVQGDIDDNCYHVVSTENHSIIDGFTITGGNASADNYYRGYGGGVINSYASSTVSNCTFRENAALLSGGAIVNRIAPQGSPTITNCKFFNNTAGDGGGAIYSVLSSPMITNCVFEGNSATQGGALFHQGTSSPAATNCTFFGNTADSGGAIYNRSISSPAVSNSIFWDNAATKDGANVFNEIIEGQDSQPLRITHSDVQGGCESTGSLCGEGNIDVDPLFVNAVSGQPADLHLRDGSPCIDTGSLDGYTAIDKSDADDDGSDSDYLSIDIDGNFRVLGTQIDMGAYETTGARAPNTICPIHVRQTGDDTATGGTWASAVATVQTGIRRATMAMIDNDGVSFCEVWVRAGSYTPTMSGDRAAAFRLHPSVHLYGGFRGTEISRDQRALEPSTETILSGDLNADDISQDMETNKDDNAYSVVIGVDGAIINGFTIVGGYAGAARMGGGGLYNWHASPTVSSCRFVENKADGLGGAILNVRSAPRIVDCLFQGNKAQSGGGIAHEMSGYSHNSIPVVMGCIFDGNSAVTGGGIYHEGASPMIINSIFKNNTAERGGGMVNTFPGNSDNFVTVSNCTFWGNTASTSGGAMNNSGRGPEISGCTFFENSARSGGAILDINSSSRIVNSIFWGNIATTSDPQIFAGGGTRVVSSNVQGGCESTDSICLDGNLDIDPLFVDADSSDGTVDLSLKSESSCVDTGDVYSSSVRDLVDLDDDGDTTESLPLDLKRNPRVMGRDVDMGAYESENTSIVSWHCPVHVRPSGDDSFTGESWSAALATVRAGIHHAEMATYADDTLDRCEVWVARGTYLPADDNNRYATFRLHPRVHLYGGFEGDETSRTERTNAPYETILSGDLLGDDVPGNLSTMNDNIFNVIQGASRAVLDGFTVTGGRSHSYGGGMFNYRASPVVENCIFRGNVANNWSSQGNGGGMYNWASSPTVTNVIFYDNQVRRDGGGMYNISGSSPVVANCTFYGNSAENGGGMYSNGYSFPIVTNSIFWENTASEEGPQMFVYVGGSNYSNAILQYSNVQGGCASTNSKCGAGNIDDDPLFVDVDATDQTVDFRLLSDSPCIDVGLDSAVPAETTTDLDGAPRKVDIAGVGNDGADVVDMGAHEKQ